MEHLFKMLTWDLDGRNSVTDERGKRPLLADSGHLYAFKYLWSEQDYVGVMAQDLLASEEFAGAVKRMPNGYYAVDYGLIGLEMTTLDRW